MSTSSGLNPSQSRAVNWNEGPLLVLAGPGSGKTRVLTHRIARLIQDSKSDRFRILALTFTNKAAGEMRTRVQKMIPDLGGRALLTTFHSFCAEVLRQHGSHIGVKPDFDILTQQEDRQAVLDEVIRQLRAAGHSIDFTAAGLLPLLDGLFDRCVADEDVVTFLAGHANAVEVSRAYAAYRVALAAGNRLDFPSLLSETVQLLARKKAIARQVQRVYRYVCVDEFQDTNLAQYLVLRAIVPEKAPNLFVVADDDQIIYQWNGASPERLEAIRRDFGMEVIQLPENYRCPADVIELANRLISRNLNRSPGKSPLASIKPHADGSVRLQRFPRFEDEVEWIAQDISQRRIQPGTIVVLARTRKLLTSVVEALDRRAVPAYIPVQKSEFASAPLRWLHSVLRLANSRQDREQLRRVCKAFFELSGENAEVSEIAANAALHAGDYLRAWLAEVLRRDSLSTSTRNHLAGPVTALSEKLDFRGLIRTSFPWFDGIRPADTAESSEFDDYVEERATWLALEADVLQKFGDQHITLNILLQEFDLASKAPPPPDGAVPCLTIHASKGMEFAHVYLMGMAEDQLPSWASKKKGDASLEMQEERRNCFVAITRAEVSLTLTYARQYFGWTKPPSRFLAEMDLIRT